jgi:hypothetical protein
MVHSGNVLLILAQSAQTSLTTNNRKVQIFRFSFSRSLTHTMQRSLRQETVRNGEDMLKLSSKCYWIVKSLNHRLSFRSSQRRHEIYS